MMFRIMPAQRKITGSYSVRKSASQSTSKSTSPSKRSVQGKCFLSEIGLEVSIHRAGLALAYVVSYFVLRYPFRQNQLTTYAYSVIGGSLYGGWHVH